MHRVSLVIAVCVDQRAGQHVVQRLIAEFRQQDFGHPLANAEILAIVGF